jgi:RNA polymerase sigma-32 factor
MSQEMGAGAFLLMLSPETAEAQRANRRFLDAALATPLLTAELERDLAIAWHDRHDERALHHLVTAYVRLVASLATRYRHYGLPMGDLIQEGNIGLLEAASRFDPARNVRFSTYAVWWIRAAMQDYVLRNWSIVRTGTTAGQKALFFNLRRLRARIAQEDGTDPDQALSTQARLRIAEHLGVNENEVAAMEQRLAANDRSLNAVPDAAGESGQEWQELLADERPNPEEVATEQHDSATRSRWLQAALDCLSSREREIVRERCLAEEATTLEALGVRLGISKERVRQIESGALRKLKSSLLRLAGPAVYAA